MTKGIQTKHHIKAPASAVWDLIKTGEKWENWLPILAGSKVQGNSRTCDVPSPEGDIDVFEEIFLASDLEKTFLYQIDKQQSFPATNIVGYIRLEANGDESTLFWSVQMEVESEEVFTALKGQVEEIYAMGAAKLEELAAVTV